MIPKPRCILAVLAALCLDGQAAEPRSLADLDRADPRDTTLPEMLAALDREAGKEGSAFQFARIFANACRRADNETLPEFIRLFNAWSADSYVKGDPFAALSDAWLRLRTPEKLSPRPVFSDAPPEGQAAPDGYPETLRKAAERYLQVAEPFRKLQEQRASREDGIDFQSHQPEYWRLIGQLLEEKEGPFTARLLAYRWGGGCGTGSETFIEPQSRALVLALAADGRWAEAAGAVLNVTPAPESDGAVRVLTACVPDPRQVVIGGLAFLATNPERFWPERNVAALLALLLRLPGDERVGALIELASRASPEMQPLYFRALGKFVPQEEGGAFGRVIGGSSGLYDVEARPVGAAARKQALAFLCAQASADLSIDAARELASIFQMKQRPETIAALRRLLDHPSLTVAKEAAEALESIGEKAVIPPKQGPVRYRLVVDGKPFAGRKVEWAVKRKNTSTCSEVSTDADGVAAVPRDVFIDSGRGPVERVVLRSAATSSPGDPWFDARMPPPPASDTAIPVNVETKSLRIKLPLPRPESELRGKTMDVTLRGGLDVEEIGYRLPVHFKLPVSRELILPRLMPGTYRAEIHIPGAASWTGELPAGESSVFTVPLVRASDVKYTLRPPPPWNGSIIPVLLRDGKSVPADWDFENPRLRGVAAGHYVLRVPSSAEIRKRVIGLLPDGPEFDAVEVPFEVTSDSSLEIDLGEITPK